MVGYLCIMNYEKIYNSIIENAKKEIRSKKISYYERHHIIPRCMGGSNEATNLVLLTAKEHFVCHHLLCKMYKHKSLYFAFWAMCNQLAGDCQRKYKISARTYQEAKENFAIVNSKLHKGKTNSLKQIEISRQFMLSDKNPMLGKKGELNPLYKKPRTDETKAKISATKKANPKRNSAYKGDYITPNGSFLTIQQAADANNTTYDIVRARCKINSKVLGWGFEPLSPQ